MAANTPAASPGPGFAADAGAGLAPVARDIQGVKDRARAGALHLDREAAHQLLASLADVQARVHKLINESGELETPLRLGDNIMGQAMSQRFSEAAAGGTTAALPVLTEFSRALEDLEVTVRAASGMYIAADEAARDDLGRAAERLRTEPAPAQDSGQV